MLTMWAVWSRGQVLLGGGVVRGRWRGAVGSNRSTLALVDEGSVPGQRKAARWGGKGVTRERVVVDFRNPGWSPRASSGRDQHGLCSLRR